MTAINSTTMRTTATINEMKVLLLPFGVTTGRAEIIHIRIAITTYEIAKQLPHYPIGLQINLYTCKNLERSTQQKITICQW